MKMFITSFGTYRSGNLLFRMINAPSTFQRMMDGILSGLPFRRLYLAYVEIFTESTEEHLGHLDTVMERVASHGMRLKVRKCDLVK